MKPSTLTTLALATMLIAGTGLPRPTAAGPAAPKAAQVTISNFTFTPATLTIPHGTRVTWINHDDVPHTVVSVTKRFRSQALDTDDTFSYTFDTRGTYPYFCSVHPMMTAKVIVR